VIGQDTVDKDDARGKKNELGCVPSCQRGERSDDKRAGGKVHNEQGDKYRPVQEVQKESDDSCVKHEKKSKSLFRNEKRSQMLFPRKSRTDKGNHPKHCRMQTIFDASSAQCDSGKRDEKPFHGSAQHV